MCGCTGTTPVGQPATKAPLAMQTPSASGTVSSSSLTTVASERIIINEKINQMSGYKTTFQKYAFEDYGFQYLYSGDSFKVSINSDKPVNVLVIDKNDEIKFITADPEWSTILKKDQWDYSPLVPAFSQSNVLRSDMTFTIKDKSMYFLIIDPRFSSSQEGWRGTQHDAVNTEVKVIKL
jgi:uncharacterized protein (DUF1330 family)